MGKKIPIVSFLCGVLTRKKTPPSKPVEEGEKREDNSDFSSSGGRGRDGDATQLPEDATSGGESPDNAQTKQNDQQQPLPPPPGTGHHHMRTVSCHHQHQRSHSGVSKLVSSMSLRVMGGGGGAGRAEEKPRNKEKKFKHEDSIWKKTIILGEKCRVPDEDDDDILYDEKGNKISTYHPKSHSGVLTFSRQTSCIEQEELSRK